MPLKSLLLILFFIPLAVCAQSIHEEQNRHYSQFKYDDEQAFDLLSGYKNLQKSHLRTSATNAILQKKVFGFNPYWVGTAYNAYDYSLLSTVAYFSYEVNPQTGGYTTIHSWKTTDLVPLAQSKGVKVVLTVTNFGNTANTTLLNSLKARNVLIDSLVTLVKSRNANGINIDFESVPGAVKDSLSKFIRDLSLKMKTTIPNAVLSIDLPAVDWNNAFDVKAMLPYVDDFLIMGYDYYYAGSTTAGPVSPLNNSQTFGSLSVTKSVDDYLAKGISPNKLILAVPYYGRSWATTSDQLGATTSSTIASTSKVFSTAKTEATQYGRRWNADVSNPYYVYQNNGQWYQAWYDDFESLSLKYKMLNAKGLAGAGIWALSYDGDQPDLNRALLYAFTDAGPLTAINNPTEQAISVFPNPVRIGHNFSLQFAGKAQVQLTDMLGKIHFSMEAQNEMIISTNHLAVGLYLCQIQQDSQIIVHKVLIIN